MRLVKAEAEHRKGTSVSFVYFNQLVACILVKWFAVRRLANFCLK